MFGNEKSVKSIRNELIKLNKKLIKYKQVKKLNETKNKEIEEDCVEIEEELKKIYAELIKAENADCYISLDTLSELLHKIKFDGNINEYLKQLELDLKPLAIHKSKLSEEYSAKQDTYIVTLELDEVTGDIILSPFEGDVEKSNEQLYEAFVVKYSKVKKS